jgi:hypothetical protein
MTWREGWKDQRKLSGDKSDASLIEKAEELKNSASSLKDLTRLVSMYENILEFQPENQNVLSELCSHCALIGYGHAKTKKEKEAYLLKALHYCEKLMFLDQNFQASVNSGENAWQACGQLPKDKLDPLWWWYMAGAVYWKECRGALGRILNIRWAFRAKKVLQIMFDINPEWQHGTPYYAMAVYYSGVPGFAGGSIEKAETLFEQAIQHGPTMLNFRRSRALFLHTKTGNKAKFEEDLEWVLKQPPDAEGLSYAWNVFLQKDAQKALDDINQFF